MGEIVVVGNGKVDGTDTGERTGRGQTDGDSRTVATKDGGRAGENGTSGDTGTGNGVAGGETGKEKTVTFELSLLTEEEKAQYLAGDSEERKRLERNAKKRERYRLRKENNGQNVAPRKVNKKNNVKVAPINTQSVDMIIMSLSSIIASRPGCEHWMLTQKEVSSISEPLCKLLSESQAFEKMGEHGTEIALVMACCTVFVPRLIITVSKMEEKKKHERTGNTVDTNVKPGRIPEQVKVAEPKKSDSGINRGNDRLNAAYGDGDAKREPWLGYAIC